MGRVLKGGDEWQIATSVAKRQSGCRRTRSLNHSVYRLAYHVVWGTKYRNKFLKDYVKSEFLASLYQLRKKYPPLFISVVNTDQDHVHLQIEIPPNIAIADAIQVIKARTSQDLRKKFKFIKQMYLEKDGIWSVGYFVSSVGLNEDQVKRYIEYQGRKEKPQTTRLFDL